MSGFDSWGLKSKLFHNIIEGSKLDRTIAESCQIYIFFYLLLPLFEIIVQFIFLLEF